MPFLNLIDERHQYQNGTQKSRKIKKKGRGRRKLQADALLLSDIFGDGVIKDPISGE
jgi:hypothetical protein